MAATALLSTVTLCLGASPAHAATEGDTSSIQYARLGFPLSCGPDFTTGATWSCTTPSPIVASGIDCVESAYVDVDHRSATAPLAGCTATLNIPSSGWQGQKTCNVSVPLGTHCAGTMDLGSASFSFTPPLGASVTDVPATITDAECTDDGGRATVESTGLVDGNPFSMTSTITWVGSCNSGSAFTWIGTVTAG